MFICTVGSDGSTATHTLEELMEVDLVGQRRVILQVSFPPLPDDVFVRTIKVRRGSSGGGKNYRSVELQRVLF